MFYDYIFFKSTQIAKKLEYWADTPVLFATGVLGFGLLFNVGTLYMCLEGLRIIPFQVWEKQYKHVVGISVVCIVYGYYTFNGRHKRIIKRYEESKQKWNDFNPVVVVLAYIGISVILLVIASLFRNEKWIFEP